MGFRVSDSGLESYSSECCPCRRSSEGLIRTDGRMYSYHVEVRSVRVVGYVLRGIVITRKEQGLAPGDRDDFLPEQVSGIPDSPEN